MKFDLFTHFACVGTLEERGIKAWQAELQTGTEGAADPNTSGQDSDRLQKLFKVLYVIPGMNKLVKRFHVLRFIPVCQSYNARLED